ncbi:MAG TPA: AarF/UbiB family protein, partial [Pseudomonadales bacterium]|nr:AarF/UbiB family protein [Pseudomonadales bacterium]
MTQATVTLNEASVEETIKTDFNSLALIQGVLRLFQNLMKNSFRLFFEAKRDYGVLAEQTQQFAQGLSQQIQTVHGTLKSTPRFKKIVGVGLKIISSYRVFLLKKEFLPEAQAAEKMLELHRINAQRLHDLCAELRGGVLKLGQFISCRMDLLPAPYVEALSALQDKVPAIPADIIIARIEAELGRPLQDVFQSFDEQPLAAASLAQVHKAVLLTGEAVAVKVQVPGVRDTVEVDLNAAQSL